MSFPITVPLVSVELVGLHLSDTEPTPSKGNEIVLVKELGWTKLWLEFKVSST